MFIFLTVVCIPAPPVAAQHFIEARGADTKYRYFDYNYTFGNSAIVDLFYVGVPGSNEFNLGAGYGFKPAPSLLLAPIAYFVAGKEDDQRGAKIALLVLYEKAGWKVNSFLAHFEPSGGGVPRYQVLDTLDVSGAVFGRFEAGLSAGFFHVESTWNPQVGPLLKVNDRYGSWVVSWRFGPQNEFRLSRTVLLKN